jgi:ATP-dependent RNA helicase DDX21
MFPIQAATFNIIQRGGDCIGRARTGTGKTLAFTLPIVNKLLRQDRGLDDERILTGAARYRLPRVLVLSPTRELSLQIAQDFELSAPELSTACVYGGDPIYKQEDKLRQGVDVVVGTCGRVKDMLERNVLQFSSLRFVVLDEADEMLNMGFQEEVELILAAIPKVNRENLQTLLFSATMPSWVQKVADKYIKPDHETIDLVASQKVQASVSVQHVTIPCHFAERNNVLRDVILVYGNGKARTIVFVNTKKEANEIMGSEYMKDACQALHGDIPQAQREATLKAFKDGRFHILIATDVAARGIDIPDVELVIQTEPPSSVETYVHRSGRTGRANKTGISITFYTPRQQYLIQQIERTTKLTFIRKTIPSQRES